MAATRNMLEMVDNNRHMLYITNAQLQKLRKDVKTAKGIAQSEFERLDKIIKHGSLSANADLDVEGLRTLYELLRPNERRELLADIPEQPPIDIAPQSTHTAYSAMCMAFMAGVIFAVSIAGATFFKQ